MNEKKACPRCEKRGLKSFEQLTDEERELIKRLPGATAFSEDDRRAAHRWCTRCWYEESVINQERHA